MKKKILFDIFSERASLWAGNPAAFIFALAVVAVWAIIGPVFHYSDTEQVAINKGMTMVTFLIVLLIKSRQNHDAKAVQIKLDKLIQATEGVQAALRDLEKLTSQEINAIYKKYSLVSSEHYNLHSGKRNTYHS